MVRTICGSHFWIRKRMRTSTSILSRHFILGIFCIASSTCIAGFGQSQLDSQNNGQANKITPVKILHKPKPSYGDGQDCSTGTVVLRVQFLASGHIGEIKLVAGMTKNRNDSAIAAAKGIRFEPATKNGKAITTARVIEFAFFIY